MATGELVNEGAGLTRGPGAKIDVLQVEEEGGVCGVEFWGELLHIRGQAGHRAPGVDDGAEQPICTAPTRSSREAIWVFQTALNH